MEKKVERKKRKSGMTEEQLRDLLEKTFSPNQPLISRHDPVLNTFVAWGTLANADSVGTGISGRVRIRGKNFYERTSVIDWLVGRERE